MDLRGPFTAADGVTSSEIALLKKGGIQTVADLILTPIQDISKRCRSSPVEIKRIVDKALSRTPVPELRRLDQCPTHVDTFTSGNDVLDNMLGGGLRTGMVWEVVGESAAGKTQFALQASLLVQLPHNQGGLNASACYITTSAKLPTTRLLQISTANELFSNSSCGLKNVHTLAAPTVPILQQILIDVLPSFIREQEIKPEGRSIKLLVIDALGELFHSSDRTTTSTLVARSKDISSISATLHNLATVHQLAVLVLNEVIDIFDRPNTQNFGEYPGLLYENQSRWFNSAEFFGDRKKEASLGLVWANQVNTRIMLSRTGRRKYIDLEDLSKRARISGNTESSKQQTGQQDQQPTLIRRLSVIFSNVCLPFCLDYIVADSGILVLPDQDPQSVQSGKDMRIIMVSAAESALEVNKQPNMSQSHAISRSSDGGPHTATARKEEDDDQLWSNADSYDNLDWDALEQALSQAPAADNALGRPDD